MEIQKSIGAQIRLYRKLQGLSLEELAAKIYKSKSIISKYELGQSNIDIATLYEIASALSINVKCLLDVPANAQPAADLSRCSIFTEDKLYLYIMERDRKKQRLHQGVLILSGETDDTTTATLYMDVKDQEDHTKCNAVYRGSLLTSPYNASMLLTNPLEPSDQVSIFASISRASKNMCTGLYSGYALLDNTAFSTYMILSRTPLTEEEALKSVLMISKEKLNLLKSGNVYTALEYVDEQVLL